MWTTDQLGLASFQNEHGQWRIDARGGTAAITMTAASPSGSASPSCSLAAVDQPTLPAASEQFVCGDRWTVNYPQADGTYALRLAWQPITSSVDRLLLEVTISIQTDLLDVHPKLDLVAAGDSLAALHPEADAGGAAAISIARQAQGQANLGVLLGPHDRPFTTNLSTDHELQLRLFGEFLEKGVIRRARPWIVAELAARPDSDRELTEDWNRLCASPLPLT